MHAAQGRPFETRMPRKRQIAEDETPEHFRTHGWMRVPGAFSAGEAAAMRAAVWRGLAKVRIREGDPSTWTKERPEHLQHLKADPVFGAAWSKAMRAAIEELLEDQMWIGPKSAGAFFLAFPSRREWSVPTAGWHIDAHYLSALSPPAGIRVHALFGDVTPRGGGTLFLNGSHRLLHQWFKAHPPAPGARGADHRKSLQDHPYIRDLHTEGDTEDRVARFMDSVEEVDGITLQVVENTGAAGDVVLAHPLLLHVATANNGREPRFLLSGGVDTEAMWAQAG
jgi:hypothetical protein